MLTFHSHRGYFFVLGSFLVLFMAGCTANPLAGMHQDGVETNASVLTADGRAALDRGDYDHAVRYFSQAIAAEPKNAEARTGYAEALLKQKRFNLGNFLNSILNTQDTDSASEQAAALLTPQDWGCSDTTELNALYTSLIDALDPIARAETYGVSTDPTVNLNVGLFFVLRMASHALNLAVTLEVVKFTKGTAETEALRASDPYLNLVYDQLPEDFYWITNLPSPSQLQQIQNDIDAGINRLQTAANNSSANTRDQINGIIDLFRSLQTQTHQ